VATTFFFALYNITRYSFVAIGSKYDIALSHTVAEMKSRIWHKLAEQAVQTIDAVS